jgi:NADH:ubiquinone reductase (H+-translocating)
METPRIVIVGGGIAGLLLATELGRSLGGPGRARVSLVDRSFTHVWKPMLHTIAAGTRDVHLQSVQFLAHAQDHGYAFEPGELVAVDCVGRRVELGPILSADGRMLVEPRSLPYDWLVLALGSGVNDFGTPGVREHAHAIDHQAQAEAFNQALRGRLLRAALHDTDVRVAIVGAGATGVELAAELSDLMEQASGFGDAGLRRRLRLSLYEGGPRILGAFPERISAAGHRTLERLGFEVHTQARVEAVTAHGVTLAGRGDCPADITVWAAGVKAPAVLAGISGLHSNRLQQLEVTPGLHTTRDERIFALGDCASLQPVGSARPLPPTAQVATQQALHLARHLGDTLRGRATPAFVHRDFGALVSLGKYSAYGTLGSAGLFPGHFVRGRVAQWGHAWLHRRHQAAVLGWGRMSLGWMAEGWHRLAYPRIRLS